MSDASVVSSSSLTDNDKESNCSLDSHQKKILYSNSTATSVHAFDDNSTTECTWCEEHKRPITLLKRNVGQHRSCSLEIQQIRTPALSEEGSNQSSSNERLLLVKQLNALKNNNPEDKDEIYASELALMYHGDMKGLAYHFIYSQRQSCEAMLRGRARDHHFCDCPPTKQTSDDIRGFCCNICMRICADSAIADSIADSTIASDRPDVPGIVFKFALSFFQTGYNESTPELYAGCSLSERSAAYLPVPAAYLPVPAAAYLPVPIFLIRILLLRAGHDMRRGQHIVMYLGEMVSQTEGLCNAIVDKKSCSLKVYLALPRYTLPHQAVLNRPGDVWQEISEYRLVKDRISIRKANDLNSFDLELLNSETLVGALLRDVGNRCAQEIISLQELAKKTGRETFDTLAKKCGWEFTHEQILNFDLAKLG
eukprot:g12714.t1